MSLLDHLLGMLIQIIPKSIIENIIYGYAIIFNGEQFIDEYIVPYPQSSLTMDDTYMYFLQSDHKLFIVRINSNELFGQFYISESNSITVSNDTIYVINNSHQVLIFDKKNFFNNILQPVTIGGYGTKEGKFNNPQHIIENDNEIYIADTNNHRIQVFDKLTLIYKRIIGRRIVDVIKSTTQRIEFDNSIDIDYNFFDHGASRSIAKIHNKGMWKSKPSYIIKKHLDNLVTKNSYVHLNNPYKMTIYDNELYVLTNNKKGCVYTYDKKTGKFIKNFGVTDKKYNHLRNPSDISVTDNEIFILDNYNKKIFVFSRYTNHCLREIVLYNMFNNLIYFKTDHKVNMIIRDTIIYIYISNNDKKCYTVQKRERIVT
jgi:hypothetical protein